MASKPISVLQSPANRCAGANGIGVSPLDIENTMALWGVSEFYDPSDPLAGLYQYIVTNSPVLLSGFLSSQREKPCSALFMEMCLRSKSMQWAESTLFDCNSSGVLDPAAADISTTQSDVALAEKISSDIPVVGSVVASIGGIIDDIVGIFSGNAKRIAEEKQITCSLLAPVTNAMRQIYTAVGAGQATGHQGYQGMIAIQAQVVQADKSVTNNCDESCFQNAILEAQVQLAGYLFGVNPYPSGVVTPTRVVDGSPFANSLFGMLPAGFSDGFHTAASATGVESSGFGSIPLWAWLIGLGIILLLLLHPSFWKEVTHV